MSLIVLLESFLKYIDVLVVLLEPPIVLNGRNLLDAFKRRNDDNDDNDHNNDNNYIYMMILYIIKELLGTLS